MAIDKGIYLGVDIGASTVKLGMYDEDKGPIGSRRDYPSEADKGPDATIAVVQQQLPGILAEHGLSVEDLKGVGVCMPTPVSTDGYCVYPPNIDASWKGVNVRDRFSGALSRPAVLLNDGDAAGYREHSVRKAAGRASDGMVQFITGTGLGGAIIMYDQILTGPGVAGEIGHTPTDNSSSADSCGCGAIGCAETRASLVGLANQVRHLQEGGNCPEALKGDPKLVARKLRRMAQQDEVLPEVEAIWKEYFTHLGRAMRAACNTVGCDLLVISGGAQEREEGASDRAYTRFLDQAVTWVRAQLDSSFPHLREVKVEWAIDALPDSGCYGAAAYAASTFS